MQLLEKRVTSTFNGRIKCGVSKCENAHPPGTPLGKLAHCFSEYEPALKSFIVENIQYICRSFTHSNLSLVRIALSGVFVSN